MINHDSRRRAGGRAGRLLWCGALVLALAPFQVDAQSLPSYTGGASGGTLRAGSMKASVDAWRTYAANSSGYVKIADKVRVPIGAANADMFVTRGLPFRNVMALGARAIPILGTAALAYGIYEAMGCHFSGGSFKCDMGIEPKAPGVLKKYKANAYYSTPADVAWAGTVADSCAAVANYFTDSSTLFECEVDGEWYRYKQTRKSNGQQVSVTGWSRSFSTRDETTGGGCEGGVNTRPDGRCPGGNVEDKSPDDAADHVAPKVDPGALPGGATPDGIVKQAQGSGVDAEPYVEPLPATGPDKVTQPPVVEQTTSPNGTVQVSTTTVTNNITYNGDNYVITNTTTTTNPDGSQQTKDEAPQKSDCELRPESAGCVDLGTPDPATLPTDAKNISFSPVPFAEAAGCPAPVSFSVAGGSYTFNYEPMCDTIGAWVRALVLAIGAFIASWVFIQGLKA